MKRKIYILYWTNVQHLLQVLLIALLLIPFTGYSASGSVNQTIPYTARISTSDSELLADGEYRMRFLLYQELSGGIPFYEQVQDGIAEYNLETCPITPVVNGKIDIALGSCNPLSLSDLNKTEMYLEVQLDLNEDGTYEEIFRPRKLVGSKSSSISTTQLTANTEGNENTLQINAAGNLVFDTVSSVGTLGLGTAASPYRLSLGNGDVGISDISSSVLGFFTGGVERLRLTDSGRLGILTDSPQVALDINAADAVRFPVGNTSQRPSGASGMTRFNTTEGRFEVYAGTQWRGIAYGDEGMVYATGIKDETFDVGSGLDMVSPAPAGRNIQLYPDGRILVSGRFDSYKGVAANNIIRLNSDGSRDTSFDVGTGFNDMIRGSVLQPDGKIVVFGPFTSYQGVAANRIIRLNPDGSRDTTFNVGTGFNEIAYDAALQLDGKIVVVGGFTSYQGVAANRIIRLNPGGSRDTTFNTGSGLNTIAYNVLTQPDGKIVASGFFTEYQGISSGRIVRINSNGSRDATFNMGTGFNNIVNDVQRQSDGKYLVGGLYTQYNGTPQVSLARLNSDGSKDITFNPNAANPTITNPSQSSINIWSIAIQTDDKIIVGGQFTTFNSTPANNIIRLNSNGSVDPSFDIGTGFSGGLVFSVKVQYDNKLVATGMFTSYDGQPSKSIIRIR